MYIYWSAHMTVQKKWILIDSIKRNHKQHSKRKKKMKKHTLVKKNVHMTLLANIQHKKIKYMLQ